MRHTDIYLKYFHSVYKGIIAFVYMSVHSILFRILSSYQSKPQVLKVAHYLDHNKFSVRNETGLMELLDTYN
jgi:hypothetical protein